MKFKSDIEVQAGLRDGSDDIGTAGQLLSSTGTITNWIDQAEVVAAGATSVLIACKNTSGGTITKGTPVYQTGNVGATDVITVAEADALISTGYLPAIGLLETDLINNAFGHVVITGELLNITTSPIDGVVPVTGDTIYLKSGGGLTLTKPTGEGNAIQNLGLVGKVSGGNAGSLTVASIMRQNDVPNLPEGRIWIGDGNTIVSDTVYVDEPNNRVGINTATPIYDLDVDGGLRATSWSYFSTDGPTSIAQLGGGTTTTSQFNITSTAAGGSFIAATNTLSIKANNTTAIKIDNAANVGIGTTNPDTKLEVSSSSGGVLRLTSSDTSVAIGESIGRVEFKSNDASTGGNNVMGFVDCLATNAGSTYALTFGTGNAAAATEKMRINQSGNVGIGTINPSTVLEVSSTGVNGVDISQSASNASQSGRLFFTTNTASEGFALFNSNGTFQVNSGGIPNNTSGTNRISIIGSSGNVGIGTTNPITSLTLGTGSSGISFQSSSTTLNSGKIAVIKQVEVGNGNGNLAFETYQGGGGGGERMRILNDGNVGINTTDPKTKLHVASANGSDVPTAGTATGGLFVSNTNKTYGTNIGVSGSGWSFIQSQRADGLSNLYSLNLQPLGGNVGIGTTSPSELLHLRSTGPARLLIEADTDNITETDNAQIILKQDGGAVVGNLGYKTNTNGLEITNNYAAADGILTLGTSGIERMRIDYLGNVGIGTTSLTAISSSVATLSLGSTSASTSGGIAFQANGVVKAYNYVASNYLYSQTVGGIGQIFYIAGSERMRIHNTTGNVGIGTTSPRSKLQVEGVTGSVPALGAAASAAQIGGSSYGTLFSTLTSGTGVIQQGRSDGVTLTFPLLINPNGGNVGIGVTSPSYQLQLSTNSAAKPSSSAWTVTSDSRVKENVRDYKTGLEAILSIEPKLYDYNGKAGFEKTKDNIGVIAQEIQEVMPETINTYKAKLNEGDEEETELLNFDSHAVTFALINAVKDLKAEIDELKKQINN